MTGLDLLEAQARELGWWDTPWCTPRHATTLGRFGWHVFVVRGRAEASVWLRLENNDIKHWDDVPIATALLWLSYARDGATMPCSTCSGSKVETAIATGPTRAKARAAARFPGPAVTGWECKVEGPSGTSVSMATAVYSATIIRPCPDCESIARLILDSMPRECEACEGEGEQRETIMPKVYDLSHDPERIEDIVAWHRARWERVEESRKHLDNGDIATICLRCSRTCPGCRGSGQVDPMSPDTRERLTIEADRRQELGELRGEALALWLAGELGWELFAGQGARATG